MIFSQPLRACDEENFQNETSKSYTFLIVEDNAFCRFVLKTQLEQFKGVVVEEAFDGQKALEKIEAGSTYDAIFLDYEMPNMNGFELLEKLRHKNYTLKPIVIAHSSENAKNAELIEEFKEYICSNLLKGNAGNTRKKLKLCLESAGVTRLKLKRKSKKPTRLRSLSNSSPIKLDGTFSPVTSPRNFDK